MPSQAQVSALQVITPSGKTTRRNSEAYPEIEGHPTEGDKGYSIKTVHA